MKFVVTVLVERTGCYKVEWHHYVVVPVVLTLNVSRDFTLVARAVLIDLSNCRRTLMASCGVICPYWNKEWRKRIKQIITSHKKNRLNKWQTNVPFRIIKQICFMWKLQDYTTNTKIYIGTYIEHLTLQIFNLEIKYIQPSFYPRVI